MTRVIAELPSERQERIEARYQELKQEVEGLRELRQIAGKAQLDIADALNIKQPSVSKIEKQTDMYFQLFAATSRRLAESLNWLSNSRNTRPFTYSNSAMCCRLPILPL